MSIFKRLKENSLIVLAGPILRRTESERICIWLATSMPVFVRTEIFKTKRISRKSLLEVLPDRIGVGEEHSITLGEHLHITLVQARPVQPKGSLKSGESFPTDELLAYDLEIFENQSSNLNERGKRLKDIGLIDQSNGINYPNVSLPTFFLRGHNNPLNILHGSCRKLHGPDEDCLAIAEKVIGENLSELSRRPSVLFLTGDQIYADDVALPLIKHLTSFGKILLGWEETIPENVRPSDFPVGGRGKFVKEKAKFTSGFADNHLLSFGEYAAMYLVAWNLENWPELAGFPDNDEKKNLERARATLPAVRRLLANIPTYMILDDHEITDDWNINKEWFQDLSNSACGKRVVANGLAAYWAFQAWGNEPELFDEKFCETITDYLSSQGKKGQSVFENTLRGYHWTFYAPTDPLTIFIDTRTTRHYDEGKKDQDAARLLSEEGMEVISQTIQRAEYRTSGKPLLMVSPSPVYGFELVEEVQETLSAWTGPYKFDLEAWRSNLGGFIDFMTYLIDNLNLRSCIFLSGDVHYAFSISATFRLQRLHKTLPITQLTSSALKNTGKMNKYVAGGFAQLFDKRIDVRLGWNKCPTSLKLQRLRKERDKELPFPGGNSRLENIESEIRSIERKLSLGPPPRSPLTLSPYDTASLEIREIYDWWEIRAYKETSRFTHLPVVGENNIGLVSLERNGTRLEHKLYLGWENGRNPEVVSSTIDTIPLEQPQVSNFSPPI